MNSSAFGPAPPPAFARRLTSFARSLASNRALIWMMAERSLSARYAGTTGGMLWAVAQPLGSICVFWLVFSVGFRATGPLNLPFILYYVTGLVPWMYFSEVLSSGAVCVTSQAHLIKKTVFPSEVLPIVALLAATMNHLVFFLLMLAVVSAHGIPIDSRLLALPYYMVSLAVWTLGVSWLLAALNVLFRDVGETLSTVLNFWFWLTPVVWSSEIVPAEWRWLLAFNPATYVVEGYRRVLLYDGALFPPAVETTFFWALALAMLVCGAETFRRLKGDFADVL